MNYVASLVINIIFLETLAKILCYAEVEKHYSCEARRLVDIAIRGSYLVDNICYNLDGWMQGDSIQWKPKRIIWKAFLKRKCCLRCGKKDNQLHTKRVYCIKCYTMIKKEENDGIKDKRISVCDEVKKKLRIAFRWLDNVPGGCVLGMPCHFCGRTYFGNYESDDYKQLWEPRSNYVSGNVWWFGDEKRCCTVCLHEQVKIKGIKLDK